MRLGKEQATGYVEDIEAGALAAEEITVERAEHLPPLTTEPEPSLTAR